ncbi:hypothetical protein [Rhodohalobacter sp. 8-1]|uniref:hypothetical protein n=1 Tax=Rhodohalobacter sp. 8-1 TaxID=3131972 RepID=UPI0030EF1B8C
MKSLLLVPILLFLFSLISCSSSTEPGITLFDIQGDNGFMGSVDGTNAFISILVGKSDGIVYICNGDEEISEWFSGSTIKDPSDINFTNDAGAQISAQFAGSSFSGKVTLRNGSNYSFTASPITHDDAGVYRVMGDPSIRDDIEAGWIVSSAGDVRGALKSKSTFMRAPAVPQKDIIINNSSYPVFQYKTPAPSPAGPVPIPYPNDQGDFCIFIWCIPKNG